MDYLYIDAFILGATSEIHMNALVETKILKKYILTSKCPKL